MTILDECPYKLRLLIFRAFLFCIGSKMMIFMSVINVCLDNVVTMFVIKLIVR